MPAAWTDNFDAAGYDWSQSAVLQMFWGALIERYNAWGYYSPMPTSPSTLFGGMSGGGGEQIPSSYLPGGPVVGTDVQAAAFWQVLQQWVTFMLASLVRAGWVKAAGFDGAAAVVDTSLNFSSFLAGIYTFGTLRTELGYDPTGWRRKKPREILHTSDTADTDSNAVADGQRAWLRASPHADLYQYSAAAGKWIYCGESGALCADVLDSDSAAPNTTTSGFIKAGDYIGGWLLNELRDMMRRMTCLATADDYVGPRRVGGAFPYVIYGTTSRYGTSDLFFFDSTWAAAQADAATNFAAGLGNPGISDAPACAWTDGAGGGSGWLAQASKKSCGLIQQGVVGSANTLNFVTSFYVFCAVPYEAEVPLAWAPSTFDANGQTWAVQDTYQLFQTLPATNSTAPQTSNTVGDTTASVPNWLTPTATFAGQGWWLQGAIAQCDFDVSGGFQYV